MPRVAPEDQKTITHIEFVCGQIHDFGDKLYEDLMERDYKSAKQSTQELIKELADLIQSMSDEV
jgi:hypothetical protein